MSFVVPVRAPVLVALGALLLASCGQARFPCGEEGASCVAGAELCFLGDEGRKVVRCVPLLDGCVSCDCASGSILGDPSAAKVCGGLVGSFSGGCGSRNDGSQGVEITVRRSCTR